MTKKQLWNYFENASSIEITEYMKIQNNKHLPGKMAEHILNNMIGSLELALMR